MKSRKNYYKLIYSYKYSKFKCELSSHFRIMTNRAADLINKNVNYGIIKAIVF